MATAPYKAGTNSAASGGSASLVVPITTTTGNGDSLFVAVAVTIASVTPTVADTAGNVYTQVLSDTTEAAAQLYVFECDGSNVLTSGVDAVTVTYSATTSAQAAAVIGDPGVTTADKLVIAHGSSTAPSSGSSGTLSQVEEHAIAINVRAVAGSTLTYASPWSSNVLLSKLEAGTTAYMDIAEQTVTANTALTASGTMTTAAWTQAIITTKVDPVVVTTVMSNAVEGLAYSQTLEASGGVGAYTWSISAGSLPTGLTLASGVISGTPSVSGTFSFTVEATDAHSVAGTLVQTIIIAPASPTSAVTMTSLPGNRLSASDSDLESGSPTWAALLNAGTPGTTIKASVTGTHSGYWASSADGETSINTGYYSVTAGLPYIASGFIMPTGQLVSGRIGIAWYTSGNSLIETDFGAYNPASGLGWEPVQGAFTAPLTAAKCKLVLDIETSNKGDTTLYDLMYLAQADTQVLIDWQNGPFATATSSGQDFMDVSPWVRNDQGISLTRGRQDSISEIQAGSANFQLQNDNGEFTLLKSASLVAITGGAALLQRRYQINFADENGAWYTRADGPISEINYTFDNTGNTSIAQITGTDILAYLSREEQLSCWTKEQVLANGPLYHWSLNDADTSGSAGVAAETSGNNGPPLRTVNRASLATIAFADTTGGVETLANAIAPGQPDGSEYWQAGNNQPNSVTRGLDSGQVGPNTTPMPNIRLVPVLGAKAGKNYFISNSGYQLRASLINPIEPTATGNDFSFELWFTLDPAQAADIADDYGPFVQFSLYDSTSGFTLLAGNYLLTSTFRYTIATYAQPPSFTNANFGGAPGTALAFAGTGGITALDTVNLPHHLVITISGSPTAATVEGFLDGTDSFGGTLTLPEGQTFDTIIIGGEPGGYGSHYGSLSMLSVYPFVMPQSMISQDCQFGQYGAWEMTTDDCVAALAGFGNVPTFWDSVSGKHYGLSLTDYQDISSYNALSAMQIYEQAEQGLLFVDATGALNFHTRDWRMGHGAPDLALLDDSFDADMGYNVIDQFQINEYAVASQTFPTGGSYVNSDSQEEYGTYAQYPIGSPNQLPLISWNRASGALGISSFYYFSAPNMDDYAAWEANAHSDPWLCPGELTFDVRAPGSMSLSDLYSVEIDDLIAPSSESTWPESFPDESLSTEWFIEGINETKTTSAHTIQFYTSPAETQRAWVPGDSVYGVLGTTTRVGVSATDTSTPQADGKDVSHDAGPPYWPTGFLPAAPFQAALGSAGVATTAFTLDVQQACPAGSALLVGVTVGNNTSQTVSVSDTQGNHYTAVTDELNGTSPAVGLYVLKALDIAALTDNDTITITVTNSELLQMQVFCVPDAVAIDGTAVATGNSAAPSVTMANQSQAGDANIVFFGNNIGSSAATINNWQNIGSAVSSTIQQDVFYRASLNDNDVCSTVITSTPWVAIAIGVQINPSVVLNNPASDGHSFVGGLDVRGWTEPLRSLMNPPMLVVGAVNNAQTMPTGSNSAPQIYWDTVYVDTEGGMGLIPGWPNWYCVTVPGYYDLDAIVVWASGVANGGYALQGMYVVAQDAAQAVAAGTANPTTVGKYVCPLGAQVRMNTNGQYPVCSITGRQYLGIGDMITVAAAQGFGVTHATGTAGGGSRFSLLWRGLATSDDKVQLNSSITGGSVTTGGGSGSGGGSGGGGSTTKTYVKTYNNTHTYSYYGSSLGWTRKNSDGSAYQGNPNAGIGSTAAQIVWPQSTIASDLSGATIKSVQLACTNQHTWYDSGGTMMLGYGSGNPGGSTYEITQNSHRNAFRESFSEGQYKKFTIPNAFASALKSGDKFFTLGDGQTDNLEYYGYWRGGPNTWALTITYTKAA